MKQKVIISLSLVLLLAVVYFMAKDLFFNKGNRSVNPYEYNLDKLRYVDSSQICYNEIKPMNLEITEPHAIAIDDEDNLVVVGKKQAAIYVLDKKLRLQFDIDTTANCVTIDREGKIYIGFRDHIEIYNKRGKRIDSWEIKDESSYLTSIAVNDESVFVADAGNKVVYHYNLKGEFQNEIGKKDTLNGVPGFVIPSPYFDLLIGNHDELWVVNPGRHAFESYTKEGKPISSWERTSMQLEGFSGCCNPSNIAMLSSGAFVTSEKGLERVKIHEPSGDFRCVVASPELFDEGTKGLDLAVDSEDRIYILDPERKQIRIFETK